MKERRRTVRVPCLIDAQCHSPQRDVTTPVRLTNLSLQGAGMLSPHHLGTGERVSLQCSLPHDETPLSFEGEVRWTEGPSATSRRYAAGVQFSPLDDTTRFCVRTFLDDRAARLDRTASPPPWFRTLRTALSSPLSARLRRVLTGLLILGLSALIIGVHQYNRMLRQHVAARDRVIQQLESHHELLLANLHATQEQTDALSRQMGELQEYTAQIESRAEALTEQLGQMRQEYVRIFDEREQMRAELGKLTRQQQALEARFHSLPDLRRAIDDEIRLRRLQRRQERAARRAQLRMADQRDLAGGNRGYLTQRRGAAALSIQVHAPQEATAALSGGP